MPLQLAGRAADRELLKRYTGQTVGSVQAIHYDAVDMDDLLTVAGAFEPAFSVNAVSTVGQNASAEEPESKTA